MTNHDWPERLFEFIESRRYMPFAWGSNDCALFAADALQIRCGIDFAERFRGKYTSELGAAKFIRKAGGMAGFAYSLREKPQGLAQLGDVILANMEERETFGSVLRDGRWAAPGVAGLVFRPVSDAIKVFEY